MELILKRAVYRRCCWAQLAFFCLSVIIAIPYRISLKSVRGVGVDSVFGCCNMRLPLIGSSASVQLSG